MNELLGSMLLVIATECNNAKTIQGAGNGICHVLLVQVPWSREVRNHFCGGNRAELTTVFTWFAVIFKADADDLTGADLSGSLTKF